MRQVGLLKYMNAITIYSECLKVWPRSCNFYCNFSTIETCDCCFTVFQRFFFFFFVIFRSELFPNGCYLAGKTDTPEESVSSSAAGHSLVDCVLRLLQTCLSDNSRYSQAVPPSDRASAAGSNISVRENLYNLSRSQQHHDAKKPVVGGQL